MASVARAIAYVGSTNCRWQHTFVEPLSHSILYALVRNFVELICHTGNGLEVDGKKFSLSTDLQNRLDAFSDKIKWPSAYNRQPPKLNRCSYLLPFFNYIDWLHACSVHVPIACTH